MSLTQIGRFTVGKVLGAGNQGTVYLCSDTELRRKVAIKLLDKSVLGSDGMQVFRQEARTISQIQHPNIVSIYEAGQHQGVPYLVFEYVEGQLLNDPGRTGGTTIPASLDIFEGILAGIDRAHRQAIVHRDLKPANIVINDEQVPKVMDFGIARVLSSASETDQELTGSPRYMAPEYISEGRVGTEMDVFALGLILYEMLTGRPVFGGTTQQALLHNIVNQAVTPPSQANPEVDEQLDRIVLKALEKSPEARYPTAGHMLEAIASYRESRHDGTETGQEGSGTIDFLIRRMRRKSDFPALSNSVRSINVLSTDSDKDVNHMAGIIIKDFALTNKILKVVNSAYYGSFSGKIGTVSRAVVVLGITAIRSLAASLIFFEHLSNKAQAEQLKDMVSASLFSAVLARRIAEQRNTDDAEEYFLSGMLHNLGKILVAFYLPDESMEVERLMREENLPPARAQYTVLGASFERIGISIAKTWNFPVALLETMNKVDPEALPKKSDAVTTRKISVNFTNEMASLIQEKGMDDQDALRTLIGSYGKGLKLPDPNAFDKLLKDSITEFSSLVTVLAPGKSTGFMGRLTTQAQSGPDAAGEPKPLAGVGDGTLELEHTVTLDQTVALEQADNGGSEDTETLLTNGLQEITNLLISGNDLVEVFNVVLETMYRAMGFHRVVLCLRDAKRGLITGRLGFGKDSESFVKQFQFAAKYTPNVFHAALKNGVDVYIADTSDAKISNDIPDWYKNISTAGSFLILPLVVNKTVLGMIYADHTHANGIRIDPKRLNLLKALRNQIVLACRSN